MKWVCDEQFLTVFEWEPVEGEYPADRWCWAKFDTEAEARAHAEKLRAANYGTEVRK